MIGPSATELSHTVNEVARLQYPQVAELLGTSSLLTTIMPRLALRRETHYPYLFTEDNLIVPLGDKSYGRVIKRDRQSGLQEIRASLADQHLEHHWLYLPQARLWVDTTTKASAGSVDPDQYAHIFLSHIFPEVETVHTHPDITAKSLVKGYPWDYSENYLLEVAQPSENDLIWHYQMTRRTSPKSHQISNIVSHYGVTSFSLNKVGANSQSLHVERYNRVMSDSSDPVHAIQTALSKMRTHAVTFEGEPAFDIAFEPFIRPSSPPIHYTQRT